MIASYYKLLVYTLRLVENASTWRVQNGLWHFASSYSQLVHAMEKQDLQTDPNGIEWPRKWKLSFKKNIPNIWGCPKKHIINFPKNYGCIIMFSHASHSNLQLGQVAERPRATHAGSLWHRMWASTKWRWFLGDLGDVADPKASWSLNLWILVIHYGELMVVINIPWITHNMEFSYSLWWSMIMSWSMFCH